MSSGRSRVERFLPPAVLAVAVYLPLLLTARGKVGADTKAYLYLDPGRLLERAWSMWDPATGLGGLSHQTIGYLWPMGPWFWVTDQLGLPDWVGQRLWLGTILFAAGCGTLWLLRTVLGWRTGPAVAAAFAYACTPYVLSLAARISVILLPFAGLPILLGLTIRAARRSPATGVGWRDPALFALVVATVGSVNATALALVGLAPVWWLVHARATGAIDTRRIGAVVARFGVLTVALNLWWIAGLWAQSGYGISILRYTETAEAVTSASNGAELLRGLGYWFFYGSDRLGPWIEPAVDYTQRLPLLALTFALPIAALLALGVVRFRERTFAVGLVAIGLLAAVGAHPYDDPPLLGRGIRAFLDTDIGLAMRSLPRAVPLLALGLAMGLGAGVDALVGWLDRRSSLPSSLPSSWSPNRVAVAVPAVVAIAAYAALPPLWTGSMVAQNLERPEDVPAYWVEATSALDARDDGTRVLELPGAEFASYRWGNTVDAITPGLMDRPQAARELIPYGSPPSADLLSAIDSRIQERTLEPGALAALARLLGAGDVLLRDDLQFERYRTPRPYVIAPFLDAEPGFDPPVGFGDAVVNHPVPAAPLDDELGLSRADAVPRPPLRSFAVTDPVPIVRAHPDTGGVVVAGDGAGLVDAVEAGLVRGDELVRYAASLGEDEGGDEGSVADALAAGAAYVITDGNRRQARRWSTVRDVVGLVEPPGGSAVLRDDPSDNRLPLFAGSAGGSAGGDGDAWRTTAAVGALTVQATTYGNPISFTPEYRPANAADGDVATEWRTGADSNVVGERLRLTINDEAGSQATGLRLVQQLSGARNRHITEIDVRIDGGATQRVLLDERSLAPEGQEVALSRGGDGESFHELEIEVRADSTGRRSRWGRPQRFVGLTQVGFAEVQLLGDPAAAAAAAPPRVDHALVLPPAATEAIEAESPVALVLTRWRTDPTDAVRQDPETALARRWSQPVARAFTVGGVARLTPDALDPIVDASLGVAGGLTVSSSTRLIGVPAARASAALDGDPTTWWSPSFFDERPSITITAPGGRAGPPITIDRVAPVVVDDGLRSMPTRLRFETIDRGSAPFTGAPVEVDLPGGGAGGAREITLSTPLTGTEFRVTVVEVAARSSIDWFSQGPITLPPAITELGIAGPGGGIVAARPETFDTGCRSDLLTLDGAAVPVRVTGSTTAALDGAGFTIEHCGPALVLGPGEHDLRAANGLATGIDLDRLVLSSEGSTASSGVPAASPPAPTVEVLEDDGWKLRVRVSGAEAGAPFWLVLGQSHNLGWRLDGDEPELVDGFANGWLVTPDGESFELDLVWTPQRIVNIGLAASATAAALCLAILAVSWWRRRGGPDDDAEWGPGPADDRRSTWHRSPVVVVTAVTLGALVAIGPVSALVVGAAGVAAMRWPVARRWLTLAPAAVYALAAAYILTRQAVSKPSPAFEWPAEQATAHQPALVAVALLVLAVALGDRATEPGSQPPGATGSPGPAAPTLPGGPAGSGSIRAARPLRTDRAAGG